MRGGELHVVEVRGPLGAELLQQALALDPGSEVSRSEGRLELRELVESDGGAPLVVLHCDIDHPIPL